MELNFYTLCVIYLVYSFLGWVAETVVATIKGRAFVNRGVASGPFCFVYGTAAVLMAVGFADLRSTPVALFLGCAANATVVEWATAKLLERMHRRRWWDYSDKKFNLDGYVCLQYSVLWGLLGMASVLWGNVLLLRLCAILPGWLLHIGVWAAMTLAVLDQLGAALAVNRYAASHPRLEQLNLELEKHSDKLRQRLIAHVEKRIQRAYPTIVKKHIPHWSKGILNVTGVRLSVEGLDNIPKDGPCVFVANHRSYYDIPLLLASLDEPYGILAKEELGKIPLLNRWMKLLGCVFVQRDDVRASVRALNDATAIVESGRSFIIFPEGTRYKGEEGGAGEFKAGAFRIAVKTGAPVVPVAISGARGLFEAHGNRATPGTVYVRVLPPIQTAGMSRAEQKQLPDAVRQTILAEL